MKWLLRITAVAIGFIFILSCSKEPPQPGTDQPDRFDVLRQRNEITGQLRPFELITHPDYVAVSSVGYLDGQDRVLLYKSGPDIYVYPLPGMYVEIVNDQISSIPVAITFCPLTHSGMGWNRVLEGDTLLLTASGYLYKDNLMPLDIHSESIFSQMLSSGFKGKFESTALQNLRLIETTWKNVKESFPSAKVFRNNLLKSTSEGYRLNNSQNDQELLERLAYGVIGIKSTVIVLLNEFPQEVDIKVDIITGQGRVVFVGSGKYSFITAFRSNYEFQPLQDEFPVILKDGSGTKWNIFGEAVSGPKKGEVLLPARGYLALDWAFFDIFENAVLY